MKDMHHIVLGAAVKERADHESLVNLERCANLEKSVSLEKRVSLVVVHVGEFRVVLGCLGMKINNNFWSYY